MHTRFLCSARSWIVLSVWLLAEFGSVAQGDQRGVFDTRDIGRYYEPVEVPGELLPSMVTRKISEFGLYAWRQDTWHTVLFQIDERTKEGAFVLSKGQDGHPNAADGVFDPQDLLVYMAREAGHRAPDGVVPPNADHTVPIEIHDILTGQSAWVYLSWHGDGTPPSIKEPLVRLVDDPGMFTFLFPTYRYEALINNPQRNPIPTIYMNKLWILPEAGGTGENIIDRQKVRGVITALGALIDIRFDESIVKGGIVGYKQGPVRILTRSCMYPQFPLGIRGPRFYMDSIMVDTITLTTIIISVPFNPGYVMREMRLAFGTDLTPAAKGMRFYNSRNRDGFVIDGIMAEEEKGYDSAKDEWRLITGPQGTQITSTRFDEKFFAKGKARVRYNDNQADPHPPEHFPGDIGAAFDEVIVESLPAGTYRIEVFGCIPYEFYSPQGLNTRLLESIMNIRSVPLVIRAEGREASNQGCQPRVLASTL